jgi:hypothetical protein
VRVVPEVVERLVEGVAVDQRAAADAGRAEERALAEQADPLRAGEPESGGPDRVAQSPVGLREVLRSPPPARFQDADPVALLGQAQRADAAAEARTDDDHVVVELGHVASGRSAVRLSYGFVDSPPIRVTITSRPASTKEPT